MRTKSMMGMSLVLAMTTPAVYADTSESDAINTTVVVSETEVVDAILQSAAEESNKLESSSLDEFSKSEGDSNLAKDIQTASAESQKENSSSHNEDQNKFENEAEKSNKEADSNSESDTKNQVEGDWKPEETLVKLKDVSDDRYDSEGHDYSSGGSIAAPVPEESTLVLSM